MTPRRLPLAPSAALARRGVLLAGPALLLAGCGLLPTGGADESSPGTGAGDAEGADEEPAVDPATSATLDLTTVEVSDEIVAGGLMQRLETSETLIQPYAQVTVTATTLLDSLTAEQFTALTGQEAPLPDGADPFGDESPATTLLPGELKKFLLTSWESTDPDWAPAPQHVLTALHITHLRNDDIRLDSAEEGDAERRGTVLAIVDASPDADAVTLRAEIGDEVQEISLVDGTIVATPAPRMYSGGLEVQVSDATMLDTKVPDGFAQEYMTLLGTVESAYLTPFINSGVDYGGNLNWAGEGEIFLVVELGWDRDFSSNVEDLTEMVLVLPDGTELRSAQDQFTLFYGEPFVATFTIPADLDTATVKIMPRFGQVLDEDFEQVEDPVTATLTFA
ncbi:hypothetical protein CFK38_01615 [Brachybacterium vulturis]|uniref:Uncharacterized protein n=1 Tax=Brachybacterium vulturis TaxID=2017484 RepID=A0A291GK61_9MICO|nr:hypothetical protein [Brachybacterium vulturis]ATG50364.1 hypothetical protein CFK38_01615 [Brachybacterium vulturis]